MNFHPTTRTAMEQQRHHQAEGTAKVNWTKMPASPITLQEKTQKVFPEKNFLVKSEAELFYGIALPEGEEVGEEGESVCVLVW